MKAGIPKGCGAWIAARGAQHHARPAHGSAAFETAVGNCEPYGWRQWSHGTSRGITHAAFLCGLLGHCAENIRGAWRQRLKPLPLDRSNFEMLHSSICHSAENALSGRIRATLRRQAETSHAARIFLRQPLAADEHYRWRQHRW